MKVLEIGLFWLRRRTRALPPAKALLRIPGTSDTQPQEESLGDEDAIKPRYSIAVDAEFVFHFDEPGFAPPTAEIFKHERKTVTFFFEGREITWHELGPEYYPAITVPVDDKASYDEEMGVVLRFLSALSYETGMPVDVIQVGGGAPARRDQVVSRRPRRLGALHTNPDQVRVPPDGLSRKAIGFWREGRSERSPFYGFLAYWKVLEAVVGNDPGQIARWIEDHARADELGLGDEMRDRCRDAAAHGERSRGSKTVVDPDDPRDRRRMEEARHRLGELARHAIDDRWPRPWA